MAFTTIDEWKRLDADPDPVRDLGYTPGEWTVRETNHSGTSHVVFVSNREADQGRESFIIASRVSVRDLLDAR